MKIITFGTFDLFHIGHLNIIKKCKEYNNENNYLIVGISTDEFNNKKKDKYPIINQYQRLEIIKSLKYVDEVFYEESLEEKLYYCEKYKVDICIMGYDHKGKFDFLNKYGIKTYYFDRTNNISTTELINKIKS
jgi:glycerol-3-phosphate cytidylyltransferase